MKGGILAAWLAGEAIVIWRIVHRDHSLPAPGALLGITGLFMAGALIADIYPPSATLVTAGLFGLDVAALLNMPQAFWGQVAAASQPAATAAPAAGTGGSAAGEGSGGKLRG
jgi:hypothetical protein